MNYSVIFNKPNLIGYARLVLLTASVFSSRIAFVLLYLASVSLDYFDGMAARYFSEESRLGACLDMIIDRVSTTIISLRLAEIKKHYREWCCIYIICDLIGHFLYFIGTSLAKAHHKSYRAGTLMSIYYNSLFLKLMCCGSELFFILACLLEKTTLIEKVLATIPIIKTFFHLLHMFAGIGMLSEAPNLSGPQKD